MVHAFAEQKIPISVSYDSTSGQYSVSNTYDSGADAFGYFYLNLNQSGWNYLDASMYTEISSVDAHLQYAKSLGYLEGYVTCDTIHTFYPNFYSAIFGTSEPGAQTLQFIQDNYAWMQAMVSQYAAVDDYWYTISTVLQQVNGLYEGYKAGCGGKYIPSPDATNPWATLDAPTLTHFLLMNAWGDLYQITMKYREVGNPLRLAKLNRGRGAGGLAKESDLVTLAEQLKAFERCSAIIKVLPDHSDVVFGHATWDSYESLGPRILKHYSMPLVRNGFAETHYDVYFSSSPALLSSVDDFFTVSGYSQLAVIETTNNLYNLKLLDIVTPKSVLSWTRAITSHQMAKNGADWVQQFAKYHSGTYTNQWMVVDFKLFQAGAKAQPEGFFTIFEEVPGLYHIADKTATLNADGYWGSYNVPYFDDISEASGYAKLCKMDSTNCHDTAPRAKLFREYQPQVNNVEGAQWILSYNSFQNDTASLEDSCNTIACRGDLEPKERNRGAYGALDAKVSSVINAKRYPGIPPVLYARLGPTHDQQPVFCWSQVADESDYSHNGQPDCYDFTWTSFPPKN